MKYLFILLIIVGGSLIYVFGPQVSSIDTETDEATKGGEVVTNGQAGSVDSTITENVPGLKALDNMDEFRSLVEGDSLGLILRSDAYDQKVFIDIAEVVNQSGFEQYKGTVYPDGQAIVTVGKTSINVFVNLQGRMYQYSGKEFDGILEQVIDLNLGNDVRDESHRVRDLPNG